MDYAVIRAGGKQLKVSEGDVVSIEREPGAQGETITFDEVLLASVGGATKIGSPLVEGAKVEAVIEQQARGRKIVVRKFKRRKGYLRTRGHRQYFTRVRVQSISA